MNEYEDRIRRLIEKRIKGEALTESERDELNQFTNESVEHKKFIEELSDKEYLERQIQRFGKINVEEAFTRFTSGQEKSSATVVQMRRRTFARFTVAASVILLISVIYFWQQNNSRKLAIPITKTQDFSPGGNRAVLRVSNDRGNGPVFLLDSAKDGSLITGNDLTVVKQNDSLVEYKVNNSSAATAEIEYHTISTPAGGQYQVVLSDGSKVWLNSASSVRFPTRFVGSDRKVEITGEVYLEVAKNASKPFLVKNGDTEIEVLGTHFNVNAYDDEPTLNTTLLEGSIRITNSGSSKILKPGQQARISKSGNLKIVNDANLDQVVAWKNGTFRFDEANIQAIMRQISRWYDVEIEYRGNIPEIKFMGGISRYSNASKALEVLEMTGGMHFKIEGRKIIVQP